MYKLHFDNFLINEHDDDDYFTSRRKYDLSQTEKDSEMPFKTLNNSVI